VSTKDRHEGATKVSYSSGRQISRDDSGAVAIVVAVVLVILFGLGAIVIDAGALYSHRRQIQSAADASALAGVLELPGDPAGAQSLAEQYALANSSEVDFREFLVGSTYVANDTLTVNLEDTAMGLFLARFLDRESAPVGATATALIGSPSTYGSGLMPFGILARGTTSPPYGYENGEWFELVPQDGSTGNWQFVDLTPWSASNNTKGVISAGGTSQPVSIGQTFNTQTGSPLNPNYGALTGDHFDCSPHLIEPGEDPDTLPADMRALYDSGYFSSEHLVYNEERGVWTNLHPDGSTCLRLITCPVVVIENGNPYDWGSATGNTLVRIVGFVNVFIANDPSHQDDVMWAKFIQVVPEDALNIGGYVEYAGVITRLTQ